MSSQDIEDLSIKERVNMGLFSAMFSSRREKPMGFPAFTGRANTSMR